MERQTLIDRARRSGVKRAGVVGSTFIRRQVDWRALTAATVAAVLTTLFVLTAFGQTHVSDAVMLYLLCVVLVSLRYGHTAAIMAALVSVAALDFVFVRPYLTFWVADPRDAVTLQ